MELKFKREQTDGEALFDKVVAAMETGNPAQARLVIAEHIETYPTECRNAQRYVLGEYGIRL